MGPLADLGPLGPAIALGAAGFVLIATAALAWRRHKDPLDRLGRRPQGAPAAEGLRAEAGEANLARFAGFLEPQDAEELSAVRLRLTRAGYRSKGAVQAFYAVQAALALLALAVGLGYVFWLQASGRSTGPQELAFYVLLPAAAGYYAPKMLLGRRIKARQTEITQGFPDALDMMLVCIEAGQSLDQSIVRVARELQAFYPALASEFETVAHEIKAGKDKTQVLKDMAERVDLRDVTSFVTVLVQSQTFGTSVGEALRVYAGEMRDKRVMRAEERANTLPVKMTLATMMLTVPPLIALLVGPSVYEVMQSLGEGFGGR